MKLKVNKFQEISDVSADDYLEEYIVYFESLTRNRTLKPGQDFLYQLFPGSQVFLLLD